MKGLILTYVPESECLTFDEALALAEERDRQAAEEFKASVPDSEKLSGPVLVTRVPESEKPHRDWMPLMVTGEWTPSTHPFPSPKVGPWDWDAKVIRFE